MPCYGLQPWIYTNNMVQYFVRTNALSGIRNQNLPDHNQTVTLDALDCSAMKAGYFKTSWVKIILCFYHRLSSVHICCSIRPLVVGTFTKWADQETNVWGVGTKGGSFLTEPEELSSTMQTNQKTKQRVECTFRFFSKLVIKIKILVFIGGCYFLLLWRWCLFWCKNTVYI